MTGSALAYKQSGKQQVFQNGKVRGDNISYVINLRLPSLSLPHSLQVSLQFHMNIDPNMRAHLYLYTYT
jgi:hypothetical protein